MAGFTLRPPSPFAVGATVTVYAASDWPVTQRPPSGSPPGSAVTTAVVGSDGSVAFTGLADGTSYFAYQGGHYVGFTTPAAATSGSGVTLPIATSDVTNLDTALAAKAQGFTPTAVKSGNYTAAAGDFVPVDASAASRTITLPTAPADKTRIAIKAIAVTSPNTVTIARGGTDIFNKAGGSTSLSLTVTNQAAILQYDAGGGIWYVQSTDVPLSSLVASTLVDAKGDLLVGTADDTVARKAAGANGTFLRSDTSSGDGLAYGQALNGNRAPVDQGMKVWSCDPALCPSAQTPSAGVVTLHEMSIRDAQTLAKIWFALVQGYTAGGGGAANTFFGIYALKAAGTLTLIGKTADQTAALSGVSAGPFSANLVAEAGESLALDGTKRIWGACLVGTQGSTTLQLARLQPSNGTINAGLVAGTDNLRAARSGAGLSALPATIAVSGLTVDLGAFFGAA